MSWLLSDAEFAEAERALPQGEITLPLHSFISRLVQVVAATRSLPPSLSTTGGWDAEGPARCVTPSIAAPTLGRCRASWRRACGTG
jgi:hypothetical protein